MQEMGAYQRLRRRFAVNGNFDTRYQRIEVTLSKTT